MVNAPSSVASWQSLLNKRRVIHAQQDKFTAIFISHGLIIRLIDSFKLNLKNIS
jgi:hypothetical protein